MTSREALTLLIPKDIQTHIDFRNKYGSSIKGFICKDLDRLEKLEKVIELLWRKNVNVVYIKVFKDFEKYSEYYTGYSSKDKLTKEEFNLLKEVLENEI